MRFYYPLTIFTFLISTCSFGQLLPSIGIVSLPNDNDSICTIPVYTGGFDNSGFFQGNKVPDFTLYDLNGDSVNLATELKKGKPVLLVGASYTCPVFRGTIPAINNMASIYDSMLSIYVVYTVEAHPINDPSPYSGTVWVPSQNYTEGILYEQPKTYGERKAIVDSLLAHNTINAPILIDGPCNNWWLNYGPAPNNAYLIDTSGTIVAKHPWFNRAPDNMYCALDSLLGVKSGQCINVGSNGTFSLTLNADSADYGTPAQTLAVHSDITNLSSTDNVVLDIIKKQISIPTSWGSALCADICYAPTDDSIRLTIPPSGVQPFTFYFYTETIPSQGFVRVLFRNVKISSNKLGQDFYGYTNTTLIKDIAKDEALHVFPNPAHDVIYLSKNESIEYSIVDVAGRTMKSGNAFSQIRVEELKPGVYYLFLKNKINGGRILIKE